MVTAAASALVYNPRIRRSGVSLGRTRVPLWLRFIPSPYSHNRREKAILQYLFE